MSKSTSINELPKNENNSEDIQESMMVNSILKEIENEEEINDENEDTLKYTMDTSQIPPKINNEIPTKEIIENATREIFNEINMEDEINDKEDKKEINDFLNNSDNEDEKANLVNIPDDKNDEKSKLMPDIDNVTKNIRNKIISPLVILVLFVLLNLQKVNTIIIKYLPKMANSQGGVNIIGNILKGLFISVVVFIISFFL